MKKSLFLLVCLALVACSGPQSPTRTNLRSDVLYFADSDGGRRAAREVTELFGGRQEVSVVSESIPPLEPPVPTFQAFPQYPITLKSAGITGEVTVAFVVDESGNVALATVVATTHSEFNESALEAIRKWKFKPAQRLGQNVRSLLRVPVMFGAGK